MHHQWTCCIFNTYDIFWPALKNSVQHYVYLFIYSWFKYCHHCNFIILCICINPANYLWRFAINAVQDDQTCFSLKMSKMDGWNMYQYCIINVNIVKIVGDKIHVNWTVACKMFNFKAKLIKYFLLRICLLHFWHIEYLVHV
jgi:hypothetical protein